MNSFWTQKIFLRLHGNTRFFRKKQTCHDIFFPRATTYVDHKNVMILLDELVAFFKEVFKIFHSPNDWWKTNSLSKVIKIFASHVDWVLFRWNKMKIEQVMSKNVEESSKNRWCGQISWVRENTVHFETSFSVIEMYRNDFHRKFKPFFAEIDGVFRKFKAITGFQHFT